MTRTSRTWTWDASVPTGTTSKHLPDLETCCRVCPPPFDTVLTVSAGSPEMRELWDFLQDPELVARFQRRCGLFLVGAPHPPGGGKGTAVPNGTHINGETARGHLRARWDYQDRNCNYKHTGNGAGSPTVSDRAEGNFYFIFRLLLQQQQIRTWSASLFMLFCSDPMGSD